MTPLWSHAAGPADGVPVAQSLGAYLDGLAAAYRANDAVISRHQHARYSFGALEAAVERAACGLLALGVRPGDRVGLWATNCAEWVVAQFATVSIGAIAVAINPDYRRRELEFVLTDAGITVLVAGQGCRGRDYAPILQEASRLPGLRSIVRLGSASAAGIPWSEVLDRGAEVPIARLHELKRAVHPDAPACIYYTSGTTGASKGAVISHRAILTCGAIVGDRLRLDEQDRVCVPVPFCHVFGSVVTTMAAFTHGSAIVLPSDLFHAEACLETIAAHACTALAGVPTMFVAQLEHPARDQFALHSLRTGMMAGATCSPALIHRVMAEMHIPQLTISFGMTETLATLHTELDDALESRISSVGTPLPLVECRIVEPGGGSVVRRGAVGELWTRGYGQMLGYWNATAATAAAIDAEGWMHTGDLAVMHDAGQVSIVGRLKDRIVRGGEKIDPAEIEDVLHGHPAVGDAHVIGVSDPSYGEELCAWIRLREGAHETPEGIRRFCRDAIADYKVPRYVRFVEDFPSTVTGKVQKFRMREAMEAEGLTRRSAP